MKKTIILFTGILLMCAIASAKEIKGTVLVNSQQPMEFANITAFANDKVVGGTISDESGVFNLEVPDKCDKIRISFLGYEDIEIPPVKEDLGNITLTKTTTSLNEVVVEAPLIRREADRIILNVGANPMNANKDAKELLKTAPGVWADDKDISIYGQNNVAVYIDDHQVNLRGVELMNYLRTIQSSSIGTIEILPQGGAEYSADYTGGIIIIKLKRNRVGGITGSVGVNYTTGKYKQWINPLTNLSMHSGKWTFNLNGSANGCPSERSTSYSDYSYNAVSQKMKNITNYNSKAIQANALVGVFYEATAHDRLGLQLDYNYSNTHNNNISHTRSSVSGIDDTTDGIYKHKEFFHNFNATFNWRHDLDTEGSELKLIANYNQQSSSVLENNKMTWSYLPNDSIYTTDNRYTYD